MTISIWRYSHLALAVSSFLFILLASVTGFILAFEPVSDSLKPYAVSGLDQISLAETVALSQKNYEEILELKVEKGKFVTIDAMDSEMETVKAYIDPKSGKILARIEPQSEFFQFVTILHRSLFLHGIGRFFVGLTAFLLFLIALTGSILVVKRQRQLTKFFSKVVRENQFQYYHVIFGRIWLVPILIISITGVLLTFNEFGFLETPNVAHNIDYEKVKSEPKREVSDFPAFRDILLSDVVSVEFPFSDDAEDAFTVKLAQKEIVVSQFTGEILSEHKHPEIKNYLTLGLDLHTGRANVIWALILAVACVNIVYFIYSGFAMTLKRRRGKIRNKYKKETAEIIVLAGSENGSTMGFAKAFHLSLIQSGQKSHFAELNDYATFPNAKHIVVITATYGNGEAPTNAKKALSAIRSKWQDHTVHFSVVGFGSHAYPDFCQFAHSVYNEMSREERLKPFLEIRTVNDKSIATFTEWASEWSNKANIGLDLNLNSVTEKPRKLQKFTVVKKTDSDVGNAFVVQLEPKKNRHFRSGDLLNIYPAGDHRERQYSIGKVGKSIQLSIKRHEFGLGSTFFYDLNVGQTVTGRIVPNPEFHFDQKAKSTILVSNGTGIAPFLGMIDENLLESECHLYCGFRNSRSFEPYRDFIETKIRSRKLSKLNLAYSREGEKSYVKDLLARDADFVAELLKSGGQILICGSLPMQNNVLELLTGICENELKKPLSHFQSSGQVKMDCY
ncbi:PepSY domain-containing protein [Flavobacterium selenitireducens]|uniref:PepSY domain-containing protein n=1 Tax=Flavobacterium selenitireducens TaxID=2722704 RepID=UPI00168B6E6F|nr:PepSY domain-containing protein [Flavobacterium selenitireducens]MBD3581783.1 FAD-binding oxidoreductase [Flavobacterium selenitireducens]